MRRRRPLLHAAKASNIYMTDRIQKSLIHLNPVKSLVQHHQTRMALSFPTALSRLHPSPRSAHSTMSTAHISQHTALELRARRGRVHGSCSCSCSWDIYGRIRICRRTDKTLKLNMVLSVWVSLLRVRQWRAVTRQVLYYLRVCIRLNDSAARPQGDLPWSSIDFSAFAQRKSLTTLKVTHSHVCNLTCTLTHS